MKGATRGAGTLQCYPGEFGELQPGMRRTRVDRGRGHGHCTQSPRAFTRRGDLSRSARRPNAAPASARVRVQRPERQRAPYAISRGGVERGGRSRARRPSTETGGSAASTSMGAPESPSVKPASARPRARSRWRAAGLGQAMSLPEGGWNTRSRPRRGGERRDRRRAGIGAEANDSRGPGCSSTSASTPQSGGTSAFRGTRRGRRRADRPRTRCTRRPTRGHPRSRDQRERGPRGERRLDRGRAVAQHRERRRFEARQPAHRVVSASAGRRGPVHDRAAPAGCGSSLRLASTSTPRPPLRADEQPVNGVARDVLHTRATRARERAVTGDEARAEDAVARRAKARAAANRLGVGRQRAAERRRAGRGGLDRQFLPVGRERVAQFRKRDAALRGDGEVVRMEGDDPAQARPVERHVVPRWRHGSRARARRRRPTAPRTPVSRALGHHRGGLVRRIRSKRDAGPQCRRSP